MNKEKEKKSRAPWLTALLISIIGTAIGVGLTFAVNNWMEKRHKQQTQRLMAIMVIHDIDESISSLKTLKENMETMYNATLYVWEHLNQLDSVPTDTLNKALYLIVETDEEFRFDNSKEKIFHSSPDTWQNLGCMKFIDNVQSCYHSRQEFQDAYNKSSNWQRPLSVKVFEELNAGRSNLSMDEYLDQYYLKVHQFLKENLEDEHVRYYIDCTPQRLNYIVELIKYWTQTNEENKFLMSITDEELESYVSSINTNGIAVSEKSLIGTWKRSSTDETNQFEFRKDHTYSFVSNRTSTANINFSQGKLNMIFTETGTWKLEGDTLITIPDSVGYEVDASDITVQPENQDMLDSWVQNLQKRWLEYYQREIKEGRFRGSWHARLEASRDKMELKKGEIAAYYKREK